MGQRRPHEGVGGVRPLRLGCPQERPSGRHVAEELMHLDGRAHTQSLGRHLAHPAAIDRDRRSRGVGGTGANDETRHLADARQRLAAEAERADPLEILGDPQLARGVLGDGQRQLVGRDATAVVGDPHERHAPLLERHVDPRGPRIEGVLEQFLHDARRPFHDLAGCDAVDDRGRQFLDPGHQDS